MPCLIGHEIEGTEVGTTCRYQEEAGGKDGYRVKAPLTTIPSSRSISEALMGGLYIGALLPLAARDRLRDLPWMIPVDVDWFIMLFCIVVCDSMLAVMVICPSNGRSGGSGGGGGSGRCESALKYRWSDAV